MGSPNDVIEYGNKAVSQPKKVLKDRSARRDENENLYNHDEIVAAVRALGSQPAPPAPGSDFVQSLLSDVIKAWEEAANDAVDRAIGVLSPKKSLDYSALFTQTLGIAGALTGPIAPWLGALLSTSSGVIPIFSAVYDQDNFDLEEVRVRLLRYIIDTVRTMELEVPNRTTLIANTANAFNWTKKETHEETLKSVLDPKFISTDSGTSRIKRTEMKSSIELSILLEVAGLGLITDVYSVPLITAVTKYDGKLTYAQDEGGAGNLAPPDKWQYQMVNFKFQVVRVFDFPSRIKSLLSLLNEELELSNLRVPLSIEFSIPGLGEFEYMTRTSLIRPPLTFRLEPQMKPQTSLFGVDVEHQGKNRSLEVVKSSFDDSNTRQSFEDELSKSNYGWLMGSLSFDQIFGLMLMHGAWGGPMPPIPYGR